MSFMRHPGRIVSLSIAMISVTSGCSTLRSEVSENTRAPASDFATTHVSTAPTKEQFTATASYHFAMAQAYSAEGNPDRAIEEYKLTLVFDPNSAVTYARLATEYIKKGMLSQAMETCKEAIARDEKYADARMILAGLYSSTHEYDAAIQQLNVILKQDPSNEEAVVYKAQAFLDQEKPSEATRALKDFVLKNPESSLGWYYLGRTFHKSGKIKEAEAAYLKAVDLKPNFTQALLNLGFLHEENKNNNRALQIYKDLYDQNQDVTAAGRISTIYLKAEKFEEAVPYLEAIESGDPEDMNSRVKLGLVYMELKKYEKAIAVFTDLLKVSPDSDRLHYYLGSLYEELKRTPEAIAELKQVPPSSKLYTDSVLHAANLMRQEGQASEARAYLRDSIVRSPRTTQFYVFLASMDEDDGKIGEALDTLERAHIAFPQDERVLYYMGSLYERSGQTEKGMQSMQKLLGLNPENVDALNYVGYTWTTEGKNLDQAEKYLKKAMKLKPNNPFVMDSWGWYLFVRGKTSDAIVVLEKAVSLKGDEATILEHLADAYARANLQEKALSTYQRAVKYSDEKQKDKIAAKLEAIRTVLVESGRIREGVRASRRPASVLDPEAKTE